MGASLVYLEKPNKDISFESGSDSNLEYVAGEMQGWRINMEDAHITNLSFGKRDKKFALFGVFDGHGGREVACYTKAHLEDIIDNNEAFRSGDYGEGLRQSFLGIDVELEQDKGKEELATMKRANPPNKAPLFKLLADIPLRGGDDGENLQLDSIGCTANVILIEDMKKLYVANAGDSRCVLARNGEAIALSYDHKPDNEEEKKRIEAAGSQILEGRVDGNLNLSRALGDLKYKINKDLKPEEHPVTANPDIRTFDLNGDEDFIIMGCDGIWETKSNEEMVQYIYDKFKQGKEPKDIVSDLLNDIISPDYTQTGGVGCDNMTCILIKFKNSNLK